MAEEIEKFFTEDVAGIFTSGIDMMGSIFELMKTLLENIGPLFDFVFFIINNLIDFVYGAIVMIQEVAKEFVEVLPFFMDIVSHLIDLVDYFITLAQDRWEIALVIVMLIPAYTGLFFLTNQINNIFD